MFENIQLIIRRIGNQVNNDLIDAALPIYELQRASSFRVPSDSIGFRLGRYIIRTHLAKMANCTPQNIPIELTKNGKPFCPIKKSPHFSISHCQDLLIVGFFKHPIGVDVEPLESFEKILGTENLLLHPHEKIIFKNSNHEKRAQKLLESFVLKEAFLKLQGTGLLHEPNQIQMIDHGDGHYEAISPQIEKNLLRLHTLRNKWLISTAVFL